MKQVAGECPGCRQPWPGDTPSIRGGDRHQKARRAAAGGPGCVGVGHSAPRAHQRARYVLREALRRWGASGHSCARRGVGGQARPGAFTAATPGSRPGCGHRSAWGPLPAVLGCNCPRGSPGYRLPPCGPDATVGLQDAGRVPAQVDGRGAGLRARRRAVPRSRRGGPAVAGPRAA
jgi:hypothetical protein